MNDLEIGMATGIIIISILLNIIQHYHMDKLSDNLTDGSMKLKGFRKGIRSINEKLKQYNVQVLSSISKGNRTDIENELLYLHAHDMFENIEGSKKNAN